MNALATRISRARPEIQVLALVLLLTLTACAGARPQARVPERAVPIHEEAAGALWERWAAALRSGEDPLELMATEEEIASLLAQNLSTLPLEDPAVWLTPEGVYLRGALRLAGKPTLVAHVAVEAASGVPRVTVEHVALNGHPLPRLIRLSIAQAVNDALADAALPVAIERLTFSEGLVRIVAHPR